MIPRVSRGGSSFKGAYLYFGHDKQQTTRNRIAWTQTENMMTENPDKAWKVMAYTVRERERLKEASGQKATGRPLTKPVFTYALAWHPEQNPDREHKLETARKSLAALGLAEHEALIIAHNDEPQKHVHIIVNRVHPLTGLAANLSHSKRKLSEFARMYEKENGKIYCQQREENHQKRQEGKQAKYCDLNIRDAWKQSDTGKSFADALKERGYQLARGDKRGVVVVDPHGKIHNPARHLDGVKERDIRARLGTELTAQLPVASEYARTLQQQNKTEYFNRLAQKSEASAKPQQGVPKQEPPSKDLPANVENRQTASAPETPPRQPERAPAPEPPAQTRQPEQKPEKQIKQPGGEIAQPASKPEAATPGQTKLTDPFRQANPFTPTPEMLVRLQDQHLEERYSEVERQHACIERESKLLEEHYKLKGQRKALEAMQKKVENPSWFRRILGLARDDREEFEAMRKTYENSQYRMNERMQFLEKNRKNVMEAMTKRHEEEKKLFMEHGPSALREYRAQRVQKQEAERRKGLGR